MSKISASLFNFLNDLRENNNRPWFNEHKPLYEEQLANFKSFANTLKHKMEAQDEIEGMKLYRIYRDVRFSKDKSPYKSSFSGSFKRATALRRGGYYFHIEPGKTMIAGGFWGPNAEDLKRIRQEIAADDQSLRKILNSKSFKTHFGQLEGDKVKTAPKGYKKDHPAIDLLRHKQFLLYRYFSDEVVLSDGFVNEAATTFKAMLPFHNYMSEVLTTDENGVPIV